MLSLGHAHAIYSGSNFGFNVTSKSLRESKCTTLPVGADRSAYWLPQLYFAWSSTYAL